jgi:transcription elongation factor GreA
MAKVSYLTEEGLQKLKEELDNLVNVQRPAISAMIAEARDKGDLSENAEYEAAKDAQGMLELKISKLQELMRNSRLIDESKIDLKTVQILSKVKIKNKKTNAVMVYLLVPESEADLKAGKISVETPIAKGLLGKTIGDVVEIIVPAGALQFEVIEITK